jgi:hypothetical protein
MLRIWIILRSRRRFFVMVALIPGWIRRSSYRRHKSSKVAGQKKAVPPPAAERQPK